MGRTGGAYERSIAKLRAYPAEALLDAAGVWAGRRVIDVGTRPGTVAALALTTPLSNRRRTVSATVSGGPGRPPPA
ncbi:hypothetical protein [Micromonospora sp. DT31]|uniref:hypothetical protein n=1 Tax=Micromonospora sp. DT31 TaxID=3393434 RepID=UPI003CF6AE1D